MADSAQTLINYSDGSGPAVVSQRIGRGQVITLTTPIPEPQQLDRPLWSELSVGADTWPSYFLLLGCVRTLSGADQARVNYAVGESISLTNDPLRWPSRYELFLPNEQTRGLEAIEGEILLGQFEQPGIYRLRGQRSGPVTRAVSVNVTAADTSLEEGLCKISSTGIGASTYRLARDRDEIESSVGQSRYGRELYPMLMVFVDRLVLGRTSDVKPLLQTQVEIRCNLTWYYAQNTSLRSTVLQTLKRLSLARCSMEAVSVEPVFGWYAMVPLAIIMLASLWLTLSNTSISFGGRLALMTLEATRSIGIAAGIAPARFGLDIRA